MGPRNFVQSKCTRRSCRPQRSFCVTMNKQEQRRPSPDSVQLELKDEVLEKSRSEADSALVVCILITAGLVSVSLALAFEETAVILEVFGKWVAAQLTDPSRALQTFSTMESKRLTSFECAFLAPLYALMALYPAADFTRSASRSWAVLLVIAALFGSVANTFGFHFFDLFMARCILTDSARKGVPSWHSVLLCAVLGAPAGWLSAKATAAAAAAASDAPGAG